ncbi:MAG: glycosyltransferase family 4 protein [Weeksellaceae bacterium]|nr:glycosyltransferase family 4 protein [Weeksellaceae bacterium]
MKVNFILPNFARVPSGGPKIMYEYANRLAEKGFDVQIYNCLQTPYIQYSKLKPFFIRKIISILYDNNCPKPKWFEFKKSVKFKFIKSVNNNNIRDADATISTWWSLVETISNLSESKGKKINIIQDYEIWGGSEELINQSFTYKNVKNVAISNFVFNIVKEYDDKVFFIPNAIDNNIFYDTTQINQRPPKSYIMLYSLEERKASDIGVAALIELKKIDPEISVCFFGIPKRDKNLPYWIKYYQNPRDLNKLLNKNRFFISNSIMEGWGLPVHEAMAAGCAVVITEISGHFQFINNNEAIMTYQPRVQEDLLNQLVLLNNKNAEQLKQISITNKKQVKNYNWNTSISYLIKIINSDS